jgi:hypothetical protein
MEGENAYVGINQQNALNYILLYFFYDGSYMFRQNNAIRRERLCSFLSHFRNIVVPWGWHCFSETCRSHRKRKIKKYIIQCIELVNLYVFDNARYKNKKREHACSVAKQTRGKRKIRFQTVGTISTVGTVGIVGTIGTVGTVGTVGT